MTVGNTRRQPVAAWTWSRIRQLHPSERIVRLRERFARDYAERGARIYTQDEPMAALAEAIRAAYRATFGEPTVVRRARVLTEFADRAVIGPHADDYLLGLQTCNCPWPFMSAEERAELGYDCTTGHIVHDYRALLECGTRGLREQIAAAREEADTEAATNLEAFDEAMRALATYIRRHARAARESARQLEGAEAQRWAQTADDCEELIEGMPNSFRQALQMVWFAHTFLHAENPSVAISFGRIDQYLWPYLQQDIEAGRIDMQTAFDLVCAFFLKCCEGEESQNALLGGVGEHKNDAANPLSLLMLAAMKEMNTFQPSISVRVHPLTSDEFVQAACELAACGYGQPGFMNDGVVTAALGAVGIPPQDAWNWGVVGCYEATVQGACYPNTVLGHPHLVKALAEYMATATAQSAPGFEEFMDGWWEHLGGVYEQELALAQERWDRMAEHAPSPFGSVLMRGCIERARPLEQGGADYNLVGFDILGLGTLTDSLLAIRELVYGSRELTLRELTETMSAGYPDEALRLRLRKLPHRYGTDSAASNELCRQLSEKIALMVLDSRMSHNVRPYPGFYWFSGDIYNVDMPSPDGRRAGDLISFGCGPASAVAATPTEVMCSSAHVAHELAANGNPLAITLQPSDVKGERGVGLIRHLVESYFAMGGSHVHFNVADAEMMRQAQADPENHANLTVRVSGYSARFVTVERQWQEALIERAEKGM